MKKLTGIFLIAVFFCSCHSKTAADAAEKDSYEKTKATLSDKEKKNPLEFLTVSNHTKHNILGQTVIKGSINSHASVCIYTDVQLELAFYSKTGTLLEKDNETIYDEVPPHNSIDFKTKYFAPKGSDSIAIKVMAAKSK